MTGSDNCTPARAQRAALVGILIHPPGVAVTGTGPVCNCTLTRALVVIVVVIIIICFVFQVCQ